ncbi:MAG: putative molybdenum carrier protein [Kiritimatiellae bacterium]|nr:putative molybdenum carrier protein [Kiritimatiellia bacterium]MDW8457762.1 putative molybdenum carrier protein [Verrucomicrobiota bacterium]
MAKVRPPVPRIARIVSGGQTGVDRAALDAALALGVPHGGWCPKGRLAEDGAIPRRYRLRQVKSPDPSVRTLANVRDSDATLILARGPLTGGTRYTAECARALRRPLLVVDPTGTSDPVPRILRWLARVARNRPIVLNIAGPRASQDDLYGPARQTVERLLADCAERRRLPRQSSGAG